MGSTGGRRLRVRPTETLEAVVTFALIWLAYLRTRERSLALEGLAIYVPRGQERSAALRVLCLDPSAARIRAIPTTTSRTTVTVVDRRTTAISTRAWSLAAVRRRTGPMSGNRCFSWRAWERIPRHDGRVSLRVRGMEFAEIAGERVALWA